MTERATPYHHTADAWTVGRLREALAGLPDEMPIALALPEDGRPAPLGTTFDDEWVICPVTTSAMTCAGSAAGVRSRPKSSPWPWPPSGTGVFAFASSAPAPQAFWKATRRSSGTAC
ncbi:DUF6225 family protein [Kitasatospora xanthocidica]|uniref:DUF6225 family protein n=1 Tax=Kitasatospora xanthocidica TaxID=83382 RepID=UPI0036EB9DBE